MRFSTRTHGTIGLVDPKGPLTVDSAEQFTNVIVGELEAGRTELVIDLQGVTRIDSTGLGALVHAFASADRRGGRIVLLHVNGRNHELLTMTKLLTVFDVYDYEVQALASFGARGAIVA